MQMLRISWTRSRHAQNKIEDAPYKDGRRWARAHNCVHAFAILKVQGLNTHYVGVVGGTENYAGMGL